MKLKKTDERVHSPDYSGLHVRFDQIKVRKRELAGQAGQMERHRARAKQFEAAAAELEERARSALASDLRGEHPRPSYWELQPEVERARAEANSAMAEWKRLHEEEAQLDQELLAIEKQAMDTIGAVARADHEAAVSAMYRALVALWEACRQEERVRLALRDTFSIISHPRSYASSIGETAGRYIRPLGLRSMTPGSPDDHNSNFGAWVREAVEYGYLRDVIPDDAR